MWGATRKIPHNLLFLMWMLLVPCGLHSRVKARLAEPPRRHLEDVEEPRTESDWINPEEFVLEVAERLKPHSLKTHWVEAGNVTVYDEQQVFHLHHMKTGGTSLNSVLRCALGRFQQKVPFYSLSECSGSHYKKCIDESDDKCRIKVATSAAMQYCAPLFQTNVFGWEGADAFTVLRHPVDRVWSMFRFQTKSCYKCRNLTEVYADLDIKRRDDPDAELTLCEAQLLNHQTRNLLTSPMSEDFDQDAQLEEALHNLRQRFTVVGLTEQLPLTHKILGHAFPWMAERLEEEDGNDGKACPLPHANASPKNNRCGANNSHWDLPPHPDNATRQVILEHNQLDLKLYEAAVEYFEYQKQALGWDEDVE